MGNSHSICGVTIRRIFAHRPDLAIHAFDEVMKRFNSGELKPVIDRTFPLEETHKAHARLEGRKNIGKIVLTNVHQ